MRKTVSLQLGVEKRTILSQGLPRDALLGGLGGGARGPEGMRAQRGSGDRRVYKMGKPREKKKNKAGGTVQAGLKSFGEGGRRRNGQKAS